MAGPHDDPNARRQWFLDSRVGEDGKIPPGAYLKASAHKHQILARRAALFRPPNLASVNWTPLGPAAVNHGQGTDDPVVSGRITGLAVGPGGQRIYAGAANGGVWFSGDAGNTWNPLDEWAYVSGALPRKADSLSVSTLAVVFGSSADGSHDILVVGTGEPIGQVDSYFGVGTKYSGNGGRTFTLESDLAPYATYRVAIDPDDAEYVVAATSSGVWVRTPNAQGGCTWINTLASGEMVTDIIITGTKGAIKTYYAAWPGQGIYKSSDMGMSWNPIDQYSSAFTAVSRIALAASESDLRVVYALTDTAKLYRLDSHSPNSFVEVAQVPPLFPGRQGWYDIIVAVDPADADTVYLAGDFTKDLKGKYSLSFFKGKLTGTSPAYSFPFDSANINNPAKDPTWIGSNIHADAHAFAFATNQQGTHDPSIVWIGTDGGVFASTKAGVNGTFQARNAGLNITQLSYLGQREDTDAVVYAGCQDNGTIRYWGEPAWFESPVGDGGGVAVDPKEPLNVMRQYVYASLRSASDGGLTSTSWNPVAGPLNSYDSVEALRTGFSAPLRAFAGVQEPTVVAFGTNRLWLSQDWGQSWKTLPNQTDGSDLTQDVLDDPGFRSQPVDPTQPKSPIRAIYFDSNHRIYVATLRGLYRFRQDSVNLSWSKVGISGVPFSPTEPINAIAGPQDGKGNIYVGLGGWGVDHVWFCNTISYAWEIAWKQSEFDAPVNCLVLDPANSDIIYAGTDVGVWKGARTTGGQPPRNQWSWTLFSDGLPEAAVLDLTIHKQAGLLRAATHGRGAWEIPLNDTPPNPDLYVRTNYADSGRIDKSTGRRFTWVDTVPDPTNPTAKVNHGASADIKVQRASLAPLRLPLDFPGYALQSNAIPAIDALGTNQFFIQVHNRSSLGSNPSLTVYVLLLLADASSGIPELPADYARQIGNGNIAAAWLANSGWRFADPYQPFHTAIIPSSRTSAVLEFDVSVSSLALPGSALCAAVFVTSPDDVFPGTNTETHLDLLTLAEKRVAYRSFAVNRVRWHPGGTMAAPRYLHRAVMWPNGNVLVSGGTDQKFVPIASAELYDLGGNGWTGRTAMHVARTGHTATLLPDNSTIFVTGGTSQAGGTALADTESYNPSANAWNVEQAMTWKRTGHTATLMKDGKLVIAGGMGVGNRAGIPLPSVEIFDPGTMKWLAMGPPMLCGHALHQAVLLDDGRVLVVGGRLSNAANPPVLSEVLDPNRSGWTGYKTIAADLLGGFTLTRLNNHKVLRVGGDVGGVTNTAELFDPAQNKWTAVAPMKTPRVHHAAVEVAPNLVMVAGGDNNLGNSFTSVEIYDANADKWTDGEPMIFAASYHTLTALETGDILAAGGNAAHLAGLYKR